MNPTNYDELYDAVKEKKVVAAVRKDGKKDRLFIATNHSLCAFYPKRSRVGYRISPQDFDNYVKFIGAPLPKSEEQKLKKQYAIIAKYKRMANEASFTNSWIEQCKNLPDFETWKKDLFVPSYGDLTPRPKGLFELDGITTGNKIDGKVISLSRIEKQYPHAIKRLRQAIKEQKEASILSPYVGSRVQFAGYDISISTAKKETGEFFGYLSLEFKGCGNGYYYVLINDENFIGYDVD